MSEKSPRGSKTKKAARFYRDANIIGVVACFGFGLLVPQVAIAANALGAFNLAQAAGGEVVRRSAAKRKNTPHYISITTNPLRIGACRILSSSAVPLINNMYGRTI